MTELTFAVTGEAEIERRLREVCRRLASIEVLFESNQREYDDLLERESVCHAEEHSLRMRLRQVKAGT